MCNVIQIHYNISLGRQQKNAIIHKWKFLANFEKQNKNVSQIFPVNSGKPQKNGH